MQLFFNASMNVRALERLISYRCCYRSLQLKSYSTGSSNGSPSNPNTRSAEHSSTAVTVEDLQWRKPWNERGDWYTKLNLFVLKKRGASADWMALFRAIDFHPKSILSWWRKQKEEVRHFNQRFIPLRHEMLGSNLATAHFIVHRGGSVRFAGDSKWVSQDKEGEYNLPPNYVKDIYVEAIDASGMDLVYAGLDNIVNLQKLKWLSLRGCPFIDDWCLDHISGEFKDSLEYLDISDCPKVTERGIMSFYRLSKLKTLKVGNLPSAKNLELVCLMLQDLHPQLQCEGVQYMKLKERQTN